MSFVETWKIRSPVMRVLFIVSIAYAISSVNILLLAVGIVHTVQGARYNVKVMLAYCFVSFGYGLILSAYHLYTFLARRKRTADKMADSRRPA